MKTKIKQNFIIGVFIAVLVLSISVVLGLPGQVDAATKVFNEDFATTTDRDADSTANWNTAGERGELTKDLDNWLQMEGNFYGGTITCMAISPNYDDDGTVFAGTQNGGLYRSQNRGESWTRVLISVDKIRAVVMSPNYESDGRVYAGSYGNGVFVSTTRGNSWSGINNGITNGNVLSLAISPNYDDDSTVFAGTNGGGVFRTQNAGGNWTAVNTNLSGSALQVKTIAVAPNYEFNNALFIGTLGDGVWRSTNSGDSWLFNRLGTAEVYSLSISPNFAADNTVFAGTNGNGIWRTQNNGIGWSDISGSLAAVNNQITTVACSPNYASNDVIFVGTWGNRMYMSENANDVAPTWSFRGNNTRNLYINVIVVSPFVATDNTLFTGVRGGGVWRSQSNGVLWGSQSNGIEALTIYDIAFSPNYSSDGTIFAGTGLGLYRSTTWGKSWERIVDGINIYEIYTVAVSPDYSNDGMVFIGSRGGGIYGSGDRGSSFVTRNTNLTDLNIRALKLSIDFATDNIIYAGTEDSGVFKSGSRGLNWAARNTGLTDTNIYSLETATSFPNLVFAGTDSGLFRTTDGGANWTDVSTGLGNTDVRDIRTVPNYEDRRIVYAGTNGGGVYVSVNGGVSWNERSSGIDGADLQIRKMVVAPNFSDSNTLYTATNSGQVYKTTDGGAGWYQASTNLDGSNVLALGMAPNYATNSAVFAGTFDQSGFFRNYSYATNLEFLESTRVNEQLEGIYRVNLRASMSVPTGTSLGFQVSANNGRDWEPVGGLISASEAQSGYTHDFETPGRSLRFRAFFDSDDDFRTSLLHDVRLIYQTDDLDPTSTVTTEGSYQTDEFDNVVRGTASDPGVGLRFVDIVISRGSDGLYFNGSGWQEAPTWLRAEGTDSWSYNFTPGGEDTYYIGAVATDFVGNSQLGQSTGSFSIDNTPPVTSADPVGGTYETIQEVRLSASEEAEIYYTLDGSEPSVYSTKYSSPIIFEGGETTLRFFGVDVAGNVERIIHEEVYDIDDEAPITLADPPGGTYEETQLVTLTTSEEATIYYTIDGTVPVVDGINTLSGSSPVSDIAISSNAKLQFFAIDRVGNVEEIKTEEYEILADNPMMVLGKSLSSGSGVIGWIYNSLPENTQDTLLGYSLIGMNNFFARSDIDFSYFINKYIVSNFGIIVGCLIMVVLLIYFVVQLFRNKKFGVAIVALGGDIKRWYGHIVNPSHNMSAAFVRNAKLNDDSEVFSSSYIKYKRERKAIKGYAYVLCILCLVYVGFTGQGYFSQTMAQNGTVAAGETVTYNINYSNNGRNTTDSFIISDPIPANTEYLAGTLMVNGVGQSDAADGDKGSYSGNVVSFDMGQVEPGESGIVSFKVYVSEEIDEGEIIANAATGRYFPGDIEVPSNRLVTVVSGRIESLLDTLLEGLDGILQSFGSMIDLLRENRLVQAISQNVLAPLLVPIALANIITALAATNTFLPYISYAFQFFSEPLSFIGRNRRRGWGVVYDSLTGKPVDLAIVRLYDNETNKVVATKVTDSNGRYYMLTTPGKKYRVEVTKAGYDFPSKYLDDVSEKEIQKMNIYLGGEIAYKDGEVENKGNGDLGKKGMSSLSYNIPMDSSNDTVALEGSKKVIKTDITDLKSLAASSVEKIDKEDKGLNRQNRRRKIFRTLSYFGPVLSLISLIISPSWLMAGLFGFHVILFLLFRRLAVLKKPKSWGKVYNIETGKSVSNAVVRLFDVKYGKQLMTVVTSRGGRFGFLVGKKDYILTVSKEGYSFPQGRVLIKGSKEGIVGKDLGIRKNS